MISSDDADTRIALLGDADANVRLQMVMAIGESRDAGAADALVERFAVERDFGIREALTWAVLRLPEAGLPLARAALTSDSWPARLQAAHTISKVGDRDDGRLLLEVLDDPVEIVAARAWWAAAQCGDPVAVGPLVGQLSRGGTETQNSLTVAMTHFGADAVAPLAATLAQSGSPAVRRHAADILGYLGTPLAEPARAVLQTAATTDDDDDVRLAALNALGQLVDPAAWDTIAMATTGDGRAATLAGRLLERRPTAGTRRRAELRGELDGPQLDPTDLAAPAAASWPAAPDPRLVTVEGGAWAADVVPALALQVARCGPRYLSRADVPAAVSAAIWADANAEALAAGSPADLAVRVADGRVEQHVHQTVFMEQMCVADPGRTVADLLRGTEVRITAFAGAEPPVAAG